MKNFISNLGKDIANYWQLYLVTIIVASVILLLLGVIDLPSIVDSLTKDKAA